MNFGHRLADKDNIGKFNLAMRKIQYPFSYAIPLFLALLALIQVKNLFGTAWEIGKFSTAVPESLFNLTSNLFGWDKAVWISNLVIISYIAGSITLYLFIRKLSGRHLPAIIAGLIFLLPSWPFSGVFTDRLELALNGEGAHVTALTFVFLGFAYFLNYSRFGILKDLIYFIIVSLAVTILSFFAVFVMLVMLLFLFISEALISHARIKIIRFSHIYIAILIEIVIVYNVSLFRMIFSEPGWETLKVLSNLIPLSMFILPVGGTIAFLIFDRRVNLQPLFVAIVFFIFFTILHLVRSSFDDFSLFASDRYAIEAHFGWSLFAGILSLLLFELFRSGLLINRNPRLLVHKEKFAFGFIFILITLLIIATLIPREIG